MKNHLKDIDGIVRDDLDRFSSWSVEDEYDLVPFFIDCLSHALAMRSEHQELSLELLESEALCADYILSVELYILSQFLDVFVNSHYDKLNYRGILILFKSLSIFGQERNWPQNVFNKTVLFSCGFPELLINTHVDNLSIVHASGIYYN